MAVMAVMAEMAEMAEAAPAPGAAHETALKASQEAPGALPARSV